jgi:nucleosome binding factor SPN SPT16 subunit
MSRTFLIDVDPSIEANYAYLLALQSFAIDNLRPGIVLKDFYEMLVEKVKEEREDLAGGLVRNFGSAVGLLYYGKERW